ncbi:MAG TPA: hypothetical protein VF541_14570, partial [Longimicrobium sp.]
MPDAPAEAAARSLAPEWVDFRAFFAAHPGPVLVLGGDGSVVAANAACEEVWGIPSAALAGAAFPSLFSA